MGNNSKEQIEMHTIIEQYIRKKRMGIENSEMEDLIAKNESLRKMVGGYEKLYDLHAVTSNHIDFDQWLDTKGLNMLQNVKHTLDSSNNNSLYYRFINAKFHQTANAILIYSFSSFLFVLGIIITMNNGPYAEVINTFVDPFHIIPKI